MDTSKPIRGIVTDVLDGLTIKLENGLSIHWPARGTCKLFSNVLVFWDYTRNRPKGVVKEGSIDTIEAGEPYEKEEENEPDTGEYDPGQEEICTI